MSEIQKELIRIARENDGVLTADAVVDAARDEASPLHGSFCWDDTAAARQWRLHQARNLILKIKVEMSNTEGKPIEVRAWHSLTPDREEAGGGYRAVVKIMRNVDMRAQLLADALADMARFEEKYATLTELAGVFAEMRRVKK